MDRATSASNKLEGCNPSRRARANTSDNVITYSRRGGGSTSRLMNSDSDDEVDEEERIPNDDEDVEDDFRERPPTPLNESSSCGRDGDDFVLDEFV